MTPAEVRQEIHRLVSAVELACDPSAKVKIVQDRIRALADAGQAGPKEIGWIENRLRIEFAEVV